MTLVPVPEVLVAHIPELPPGKCALVKEIDAKSSAFRAGLRKHDVIVRIADQAVLNVRDCTEKLVKIPPGQSVDMILLRGGQEKTLSFTRGNDEIPANLNVWSATTAKGFLKPGGPPAVSVQYQPMDNGKLDVTILYYADNSGKLDRLNFTGAISDIETQFQSQARDQQLPERVVDLVDVALRRLREINQSTK